jgi:hypothetical protein
LDIELEEDGTMLLSSLQAIRPSATGLSFVSDGRKRCVRVSNTKLFPPQGTWGNRTYNAIYNIPEPVKAQELQSKNASSVHSCDSTLIEKPGVLKVSAPNTHDNSCQNINMCVVRTKQSTLVMEGNVLKVGPELAVSLRYI